MDVIRDKNLVKPKRTKRRDRHKIIFCESNQRRQSHKRTEPKSVPTGKLCGSRLQEKLCGSRLQEKLCGSRLQEIKQKGKLDDRMRCRRDSVQAASPSPSTTMTGGSEGSGKTEW